ncbi:hypothetical protein BXZ70DRAFT_1013330 [Cristinia sonorae]|uniref:Uncharacterized protein n=1 Tax=Cristinia sonorae TaxID=1940300 RepID=A0A8K0UCB4_9AGAR|nr:hypothetical protein BXZ70DRAFT_1013330 [Cristinia sonorae]
MAQNAPLHPEDPHGTDNSPAVIARKRHASELLEALGQKHAKTNGGKVATKNPIKTYTQAARWAARAHDPFLNLTMVFRVGVTVEGESIDEDPEVKAMSTELRNRHYTVYKKILAATPTLRGLLDSNEFCEDPEGMAHLTNMMSSAYIGARSDDTASIRNAGIAWITPERLTPINPPIDTGSNTSKALRGFKHPLTAKLLCPHRFSADYDADPDNTRRLLDEQRIKATHKLLPAFLYDRPYNPNDIRDGLLKGYLVLRVYRSIFTGPATAMEQGPAHKLGPPCNAKKNHFYAATPHTVAYAAFQARYMLTSFDSWAVIDNFGFDSEAFYLKLVNMFESDPDGEWAKSLSRTIISIQLVRRGRGQC